MARLILRTLERIVSIPGTLDDLKKWRTLLGGIIAAPSWALLFENVRGWLVDKVAFLMALDRTLLVIGWVGASVTLFIIGAIALNTYQARRAVAVAASKEDVDDDDLDLDNEITWMNGDRAHVLVRDVGLTGNPPDMRSPWTESIGRDRMRSFYKAQSNLDDFEQEHPGSVRDGKYHSTTLYSWIGKKLQEREASEASGHTTVIYGGVHIGREPSRGQVTDIQAMTQAEYDAIPVKDEKTLYLIKDA